MTASLWKCCLNTYLNLPDYHECLLKLLAYLESPTAGGQQNQLYCLKEVRTLWKCGATLTVKLIVLSCMKPLLIILKGLTGTGTGPHRSLFPFVMRQWKHQIAIRPLEAGHSVLPLVIVLFILLTLKYLFLQCLICWHVFFLHIPFRLPFLSFREALESLFAFIVVEF